MEKQLIEEQQVLISKVIDFLVSEDQRYYYTDSQTLSGVIYDKVSSDEIASIDTISLRDLKRAEILKLMTSRSNCC